MSFRSLALAAILAVAGVASAADRDGSAAEQLGWKIALQAWTCHHTTLAETLAVCKTVGIKYIEFYPGQPVGGGVDGKVDHGSSPELRTKIKAMLAEAGVTPVAYGVVGLGKDEAGSRKVFEFAKDFGLISITSEPPEDAFDTLDKLVKEFDIRVAIHNHPKDSHYWHPDTVLKAIKGHDPRIGSCADTGHWPRSEMAAIDCMKKLEGHIQSSHLKDTDKIGKGARDVVFGTGVNDIPGQLAEFKRQNFKGAISIEYERDKKGEELIADLKVMVALVDKTAAELVKAK